MMMRGVNGDGASACLLSKRLTYEYNFHQREDPQHLSTGSRQDYGGRAVGAHQPALNKSAACQLPSPSLES